MDDRIPLSGAVLAGGMSRRMGTDKALLPLSEGGPPMLGIVLERLRAVADDVVVVANDTDRYARFGAPIVADLLPGGGALSGIHAAVAHARHDHCLIVACDMPFLNVALLHMMADQPRDYDVLVPILAGASRQSDEPHVYQTLHAIYGKGCLQPIEAHVAAEKRRVIGFFDQVRVRTIAESEIVLFDPGLRSFFNANTPDALSAAAQIDGMGNDRPALGV